RDKYWFNSTTSGYLAAWHRDNDICLEVTVPDEGQSDNVMYQLMKEELDRLLNLKVSFEEREVPCWVLKKRNASGVEKLHSKSEKSLEEMISDTASGKIAYE